MELILEKLAAGETVAQILGAHPQLTEASIRAALAFAARALRADVVYPLESIAERSPGVDDHQVLKLSARKGRVAYCG